MTVMTTEADDATTQELVVVRDQWGNDYLMHQGHDGLWHGRIRAGDELMVFTLPPEAIEIVEDDQ